MAKKTYVKVNGEFDTEGNVTPLVMWINGGRYEVDRILDMRQAASTKVGGVGLRYLVSISCEEHEVYGKRCHLWFEKGLQQEAWFVVEN